MDFQEILTAAKTDPSLSFSRNNRFTVNVDGELYIASKSVSDKVLAEVDADDEEGAMLALAGYQVFENEEGLKFISNAATERKVVKMTATFKKKLAKVETVEAETYTDRVTKAKKAFNLTTTAVV